jgi:hypothetical protein
LGAPVEVLTAWRLRALIVAVLFGLLSLAFVFTSEGRNHILRAYLMGYMTCFGFAGGGLVVLMLQYVSGGKWGLLLRRPLEAMSRFWCLRWASICISGCAIPMSIRPMPPGIRG